MLFRSLAGAAAGGGADCDHKSSYCNECCTQEQLASLNKLLELVHAATGLTFDNFLPREMLQLVGYCGAASMQIPDEFSASWQRRLAPITRQLLNDRALTERFPCVFALLGRSVYHNTSLLLASESLLFDLPARILDADFRWALNVAVVVVRCLIQPLAEDEAVRSFFRFAAKSLSPYNLPASSCIRF